MFHTVNLSAQQLAECIRHATKKSGWKSTSKKGQWGQGIGSNNDVDLSTLVGCKGEVAVETLLSNRSKLQETLNNQPSNNPNSHFDLKLQDDRTVEIKTSSQLYAQTGFIRCQTWNVKTQTHQWIPTTKPEHNGLKADIYVFCRTSQQVDDSRVDIMGFITRETILEKHNQVCDARRQSGNGPVLWKNYEISFKDLEDIRNL